MMLVESVRSVCCQRRVDAVEIAAARLITGLLMTLRRVGDEAALCVCRMLRDCHGGQHLFSEMMRVANGGVGSPGRRKYRCSGRWRHWMHVCSPGNSRTLVEDVRAIAVFVDSCMGGCLQSCAATGDEPRDIRWEEP
jgi:hypothetical protein